MSAFRWLAIGLMVPLSGGPAFSPIGAAQPSQGSTPPHCVPAVTGPVGFGDLVVSVPMGDVEGACRSDQDVLFVVANKSHSVALKRLVLEVLSVGQIHKIRVRTVTFSPATGNTWLVLKVRLRNASNHVTKLDDGQFNLELGPRMYAVDSFLADTEPYLLASQNRQLRKHATVAGSLLFQVPASDVGLLTTSPSSLLVTDFGEDFGFGTLPGGVTVVGSIRLYK